MDVPDTNVDLLIIRAGPAGLMAALCAASYGIKARIIDKRVKKLEVGFGDGFMIRTMEILDTFGLAGKVSEEGNPFTAHHSWVRNEETGALHIDKIRPSTLRLPSHRYALTLSSFRVAEIRLERIHETSDIRVERGKLPESICIDAADNEYPVKVTVRHVVDGSTDPVFNNIRVDDHSEILEQNKGSITETIRAKYVIGCDGAHSWTRKQLNIAMIGDDTDVMWGVCDVVPITDFPSIRSAFCIHSDHGGLLSVPREKGLVRLYTVLGSAQSDIQGKLIRSSVSEQTIRENMQEKMRPYDFDWKICEWWAAYQLGQRLAEDNIFKNRIFLVGDAVHTHSPQAGQGLNVSTADSYNLLWKLNLVLKKVATQDILATYRSERLREAELLINFDRAYGNLMAGRAVPGTATGADGVRTHLYQMMQASKAVYNNLQIMYLPSILMKSSLPEIDAAKKYVDNGRLPPGLVTGMRMPSHPVRRHATTWETELAERYTSDGKFKLLVFPGNLEQADKMQRYHTLGERLLVLQRTFTPPQEKLTYLIEVVTVHTADPYRIPLLDLPEVYHPFDANMGWEYNTIYYGGPDLPNFEQGRLKKDSSAYEAFDIDEDTGLLVVVRPDGYIAFKGGIEEFDAMKSYFAGFLVRQATIVDNNGVISV